MKKLSRFLAALLSVTILVQTFTINFCSAKEENATSSYSETQDPILSEQQKKEATIVTEDESKRTENSKTFLMSDGSYALALYKEPVHYQDASGNWQDIDNSLSLSSSTNSSVDQDNNTDSASSNPEASVDSQDAVNSSSSSESMITAESQNHINSSDSAESNASIDNQNSTVNSASSLEHGTSEDNQSTASSASSLNSTSSIDSPSNSLSLADSKAAQDNQELENKAAKSKIKLSTKLKSGKTVTIKKDGYSLKWGLDGANTVKSHVVTHDDSNLVQNQINQFLTVKNVESEVAYNNAFTNVDVHYILQSNDVKENIVLNNKDAQNEFTEIFDIGKMAVKQRDSKTIELFDKSDKDQKKPIYSIAAPQMEDASGIFSDGVTIKIVSQNKSKLTIQILTDENWLKDSSRVYPVTVDPYVFTSQDPATINDTFISQRLGGTNFGGNGAMYLGNETANYGACRILVKTQLPSLSKGDMIVGAKLYMVQYPDGFSSVNSSMEIDAHAMTSDWTESNATWNSMSSKYTGTVLDYFIGSKSTDNSYNTWDVTKVVKDWYNGATNYGIMLKAQDESAMSRNEYLASNNPGFNNYYPGLVINYVSNEGLENYWDYHTQPNGRAGTGHVNDYTGNLVYTLPIMSETGERAPLSINFVYNGYNSGKHFEDGTKGTINGWGWQTNLSQRIDPIIYTSNPTTTEQKRNNDLYNAGFRYVYLDEDGTEHYFNKSSTTTAAPNTYKDEDGLGITLTTNLSPTDEYYSLSFKDGTRSTYTSSGYVRKIYDSDNNFIILQYSGAVISTATDGAGRVTKFTCDASSHAITGIEQPDGNKITFSYNSGYLTTVYFADGKNASFLYDTDDSEHKMRQATDTDGSYIRYDYYGSSYACVSNRVYATAEYSADKVQGNYGYFSYNHDNSTTFTYVKSGVTTKETETFDNLGRTVSILNADGSASKKSYTSTDTKDGSANKMTDASSTTATVDNLLLDHNAELDNGTWTGSNWSSPGGQFSVDNTVSYLGTKSLKITQNNASPARSGEYQTLHNLVPGSTYTLSAYVKTSGVSGGSGANLYAVCGNSSTYSTQNGNGIFGDNDWKRISLTFTVPTGSTYVEVFGGLSYANGTAWFDCFQLETGAIMNPYNMLENNDFLYNSNYMPNQWGYVNTTSGDGITSGKVRIYGDTGLNKKFAQNVYINKPAANLAFSISGKATANAAPSGSGRFFALDLGVHYTDGTYDYHAVNFNPDTSAEQYATGVILPASSTKQVAYVVFSFIYYNNINYADFDKLQLNIDETGTSYTFDSKGNVVSSKQNSKNKATYSYSDADELESSTGSNSENYTYKHNNSSRPHQLTSARSTQTGTGLAYGYDGYGNVTNTKMGTIDTSGNLVLTSPYLETSKNYSYNGNYATTQTDQRGNGTSCSIEELSGLKTSEQDPKGNITRYTYDPKSYLLTGVSGTSSAGAISNSYTYSNNLLSSITHNGFTYNFNYDGFGNTTSIKVGSQALITNVFGTANGNLLSSTYGNGFKLGYTYDNYDRVTSVAKNSQTAYQYSYDARGNLAVSSDLLSGTNTRYSYDLSDRLLKRTVSDGSSIEYSYDNMDRSTGTSYTFAGLTKSASYSYKADNRKGDVRLLTDGTITRNYDSLNREDITDINPVKQTDPTLRTQRTFINVSGNKTTTLADTIANYKRVGGTNTTLSSYRYTYDENGNIQTITDADGKVTAYTYDQQNQLVRTDDQKSGISTTYTYDVGGNITGTKMYAYTTGDLGAQTGSSSYSYENSNWKDLLTSYNGQNITYDAIGNPLSYRDGMSFTWDGRQLKTAVANSKNLSYTYNSDGIRTSKTIDGVTTKYFVDGSTILAQQTGSDILWFLYDSDGTRVGFTYNNVAYYYTANAQGDVTGIVDKDCNTVVQYSYDAWGKLLSTTGSHADTIGKVNPFLYRGYYFDSETGLYYLNSRYYDSNTGRFLNADNQITCGNDLTGMNLFAYCGNNPANRIDSTGHAWWHWAIAATIVVACAVAVVVTAGGAAAGIAAVAAVGNGFLAATTASTIAAGAFIGSSMAFGYAALTAAASSRTTQDFADQGSWGTVAVTAGGAVLGGASAYASTRGSGSASSGKGTQNPKVKAAVQKGQAMHKQMDYGPGTLKEITIAPKCRVDGIDFSNRIIYELKPNNPQAISRGLKQLDRYTTAASQQYGGEWTGVLKLYD
ncbi:MAG TPA: DNRLRE domain-containing protein [Caproicibacter sp.]|nr:DNRLRE domain-containing protein [Caproicibacter sp.]